VPASPPGPPIEPPEPPIEPPEPPSSPAEPAYRPRVAARRRPATLVVSMSLAVVVGLVVFFLVIHVASEPGSKVNLGTKEFEVGRAVVFAQEIAQLQRPLIFPPLHGTDLTIYVQHLGSDPARGWLAFNGQPPGQPHGCFVAWQLAKQDFVNGRETGAKSDITCDPEVFPATGAGLAQYSAQVDASGELVINLESSTGTTPPTIPG
jgi:hypothetical protein